MQTVSYFLASHILNNPIIFRFILILRIIQRNQISLMTIPPKYFLLHTNKSLLKSLGILIALALFLTLHLATSTFILTLQINTIRITLSRIISRIESSRINIIISMIWICIWYFTLYVLWLLIYCTFYWIQGEIEIYYFCCNWWALILSFWRWACVGWVLLFPEVFAY